MFIRELAILVSIRIVFSMFHDLPGPVIGIKMTPRIGIPFDFSTEGRGVSAKGFSNLLLRFPFPQRLPDVKPFFIADVLVMFHGCSSSDDMDYFGHSHWGLWRSLAETRLAQFDIEDGGDSLYDAEERLYLAIQDNPGDPTPVKAFVDLMLLMNEPDSADDVLDEIAEDGVPLPLKDDKAAREKIKKYRKEMARAIRG